MKSAAKNIQLASYDDLFKTDEERLSDTQERVQSLPLDKLEPFPNHPFKVIDDDKMLETVESIKERGVLVPILVRPKNDGNFEIVSGHRRHHASQLAGLTEIPAIVREMDDDTAILLMVDSNLQREELLPSEKAFAYKMKLDAMKRQTGRKPKENDSRIGNHFDTRKSSDVLAEQTGDSKNQIFRYIRLTHLVPDLLDRVDNKTMAFNAAVEVSYLTESEQLMLCDAIEREECTPSLSQAILHDFFRIGEEDSFRFDFDTVAKRGHSFKDSICPDSIQFHSNYFELSDSKVGRVLFLKDYPAYLEDSFVKELTELNRNLILSIDIQPIPTDKALKEIQNQSLAVETDITRWQNKQNQNNNFSAIPPMQLTDARDTMRSMIDDLTMRDQRMTLCVMTLVHVADSKAQLDADTDTIRSIAGGKNCEMSVLTYQQEDALNTVLPYGLRRIDTLRTLTTESAAGLVPFSSQEIRHRGGVYYGVNATSRNLIVCDRRQLLNSNGFILGVSGSGKSFAAKEEITSIALSTDDDIIIVDPEREYAPLVRALGGEVVQISAGSPNHINAMDMTSGYGEEEGKADDPLILKSQFVMSLCEQLMKPEPVGAKERSIIGRCVGNVYREYIKNYRNPPTLKDFREELLRQPEPQAQSIALALELFVDGTLDVFAYQTNVDMSNRIMLFDIFDLGSQLKTVGMLVMLDAILNRVIENHKRGRRTWIYIDEIYLFFANEYSSNFLEESWKRFRKKNAAATGITQNVTDCLRSPTAKNMLANSEFLLMLSQAPTDQQELVKMLRISEEQLSYEKNYSRQRCAW